MVFSSPRVFAASLCLLAVVAAPGAQAAVLDEEMTVEEMFDEGAMGGPLGGLAAPRDALGIGPAQSLFEAEQALRRRVEQDPSDTDTLKRLALLLVRTDRTDEAIETLRRVLEVTPGDTATALDIVRLSASQGGAVAARAALEALIEAAPEPFPLELARVQLIHDTGARSEARDALRALADGPIDPDQRRAARLLLARFLAVDGQAEAAQAEVEAMLAETPDDADALAFRAMYRLQDLELESARTDIAAGLEAEPRNVALLRLAARAEARAGNRDAALARLEEAARASGHEPRIALETATALQEADRADEAAALLEEAMRRHPDAPQLLAALGVLRLAAEDWAGAEAVAASLRQVGTPAAIGDSEKIRVAVLQGRGQTEEAQSVLRGLAAGGADVGAAAGLVQSYLAQGDTAAAETYVEDLLAQAPGNPAALLMRGALHELADEDADAEAAYRGVVAALPQSPLAHVTLARHLMIRDDAEGAEAAIRAGLATLPGNPQLQMPLAEILVRKGDYEEALGLMEGLVQAYPDNLLVANNYAALVSDHFADDAERLERAHAVAQQLRASDIPQLRDTYGWLLHLQGRHEDALAVLEPVVAENPDDAWANYHVGMTRLATGDVAAAREHLQKAVASTDPNFTKGAAAVEALQALPAQ